jgi:hypothetical protein
MANIDNIRQEAIDLEISFNEQDGIIDLDKPGSALGGTFVGEAGQEHAAEWLANYRSVIEASDVERSK